MRILLIDDDQLMTRMYERKFKFEGDDIVTIDDGSMALDLLKKDGNFDVILLDIMMPEMNGFEFMEELNKDAGLKHIPIILLTNLVGSDEDERRGMDLGAKAYLVKSRMQPNEIVDAIRKYAAK
ncbi:hypothetical protein AUK11_02460 [bacterium CG2_30_37_16]|nr:MAG: hypothetical protein AUK11_02460 [bacterium CG2_30_37_16]PIP30272.1 MAG: response regulator [bacterium (Candidatus Howlettbacteria) CG23_combo_of_CG06-09_8_20_14_all_37_9]PIY00104.1 MAG: response regulator [bacterium (Candidatus Howlettbacteria) CG_4_10_14_3_um_filter_37_10]PJB06565.1 MAG: response regulator [bacterium (Candidatus Howlettbacteria) CG_4_9_14_3_um_filter_37_10]